MTLVGEAASVTSAVRLAEELLPDIVLMDVRMPGVDGIEATRVIRARSPHIGVIMLTMFEDDESVYAALRAGARGYVLKDADRGTLLRAIRAVARGEVLLGPSIARRVLDQFGPAAPARAPAADAPLAPRLALPLAAPFDELTARELDVLRLIARGLSNAEIAEALYLGEATVKTHVGRILTKLSLRDRVQAVVVAYESGLVTPGAG